MAAVTAPRWTYNTEHRKRPNVHPLAAPSGVVLSCDAPPDHPWHHGLWFTIKYVNGDNFWEEYDAYGVLRHRDPTTIHWIKPDRETVVIREQRTITEVPIDDAAYGLDWDVRLTPTEDVLLDRTPFTTWGGYGGLSFRGRPDFTDTRFLLDDGSVHDRMLGIPSTWCDLSGVVDGAAAGLLVCDHPDNVRTPVPWYGSVRNEHYGDEGWSNFVNAAFLWDEPLEWPKDQPLGFRYRVIAHDGSWDAERCAAEHRRFVDA
jgi:hypothetical protein